jgi:spore maturation protein CgeB
VKLLNNADEANAMGQRGREAVLGEFNWEKESSKLVAMYGAVGQGHGSQPSLIGVNLRV